MNGGPQDREFSKDPTSCSTIVLDASEEKLVHHVAARVFHPMEIPEEPQVKVFDGWYEES